MTDRQAFLSMLGDAELSDMARHGEHDASRELARRDGIPASRGAMPEDLLYERAIRDEADRDAAYLDLLGTREARDADWRDAI